MAARGTWAAVGAELSMARLEGTRLLILHSRVGTYDVGVCFSKLYRCRKARAHADVNGWTQSLRRAAPWGSGHYGYGSSLRFVRVRIGGEVRAAVSGPAITEAGEGEGWVRSHASASASVACATGYWDWGNCRNFCV